MADQIDIRTLKDGAAIERVNDALQDVWDNIIDPNMANTKRTLTLELKFSPNENRDQVGIEIGTKVKLAPPMAVVTMALVGRNAKGQGEASEYRRPKQAPVFENENVTQMPERKAQ